MKFTVHKSTLMDCLTLAIGTVSNKNTITSLEGVLLPSTVTKIDMEAFYDCADPFVIFGKKGTYAERYAKALKKHDRSIRVVFEAI